MTNTNSETEPGMGTSRPEPEKPSLKDGAPMALADEEEDEPYETGDPCPATADGVHVIDHDFRAANARTYGENMHLICCMESLSHYLRTRCAECGATGEIGPPDGRIFWSSAPPIADIPSDTYPSNEFETRMDQLVDMAYCMSRVGKRVMNALQKESFYLDGQIEEVEREAQQALRVLARLCEDLPFVLRRLAIANGG